MASKVLVFAGTVLKNLVSPPVTTKFPAEPVEWVSGCRGQIGIDIETCIFCGICSRGCPPRCITVDRKTATWGIHHFDCIQCGFCVEACPKKCLHMLPEFTEPGSVKTYHQEVNPDGPPAPAAKKAAPKKPAAGPGEPAKAQGTVQSNSGTV